MQISITNQKNMDASIKKTLRCKWDKFPRKWRSSKSGSFFTNTQPNPKEQCKAITTRRGALVGDLTREKSEQEGVVEEIIEDDESKFDEESEKKNKDSKNNKSKKKKVRMRY